MHLTQEQIEMVSEMAELFYSPADIAVNIGVSEEDLANNIKAQMDPAYRAYKKGWLTGDIKLRKSIAKSAENGSNPSQQMLRELQTKTEIIL